MQRRRALPFCAYLSGLVLACSVVSPALAHPHVWITASAEIVFSNGEFTELRHHWTFDAAYTAYAIQGLGSSDGTLSQDQLRLLAKINTESLGEFGYFTVLKTNDRPQAFAPPRDYTMVLENGQLTLTFTLPVKTPSLPDVPLSFAVNDPTSFVSFSLAEGEDAIQLVDAPQPCLTKVTRPAPALPSQTFSDAFLQALSTQSSVGTDLTIKAVITCR